MPVTCIWCAWSDSQKERRKAYHRHLWHMIDVAFENIEELGRMSPKTNWPMSDAIYTILLHEIQNLNSTLNTAIERFDPKLLWKVVPYHYAPFTSSVIYDGTKIPDIKRHFIYDKIIPKQELRFDRTEYEYSQIPTINDWEKFIDQCTGKNIINIIIKHGSSEHVFNIHCDTLEELNVYIRIIRTTIHAFYAHPYIK